MNALIILMAIMTFVFITADPYRDEPASSLNTQLKVQQSQKNIDHSDSVQDQDQA